MTEQSLNIITSDKELQHQTKKFEKWCEYYLDPKSETFGNATKSALRSYKTKKYFSAGQIGYENVKKLENLGRTFDELDGKGFVYWMKKAAKKAEEGGLTDIMTWMRELEYIPRVSNVPANQLNQQFNFGNLAEAFTQARKERGLEIPQAQPGTDSSTGSSG